MSYIIERSGMTTRLAGYGDGIVRVTRTLSKSFLPDAGPAVTAEEVPGETFTRTAGGDLVLFPGVSVRVDGKSASLTFMNTAGKILLREPEDRPCELSSAPVVLHRFDATAPLTETGGADGVRTGTVPAESCIDRVGLTGKQFFSFSGDEALYGLGSHEEGIGNLRGHRRLLYQHNLKAVVPVLVSTAGWGVLFNMGCGMEFRDDAEGSFLWVDCADELDWFFFTGDGSYASLMKRYRALTGPAAMLPDWALGLVQSKERYTCAKELEDVVLEYAQRKIPLDMIVQDWMTWPEGQWGYKRFDRSRYPRGFAEKLHSLGVKLMVSVWPNMQGDANADRLEMLRAGFMLGNRSTYNAFLPEARALYWRQASHGLFSEGVDAWWCDCTEPFESDWHGSVKPDEDSRARVNTAEAKLYLDPTKISLYCLYHSMGMWEGQRRESAKPFLNVTRSSWAGQHRYAAVTWSGDICATWETLRRQVPEGLNFFATGEPFWHCDIGGFFTDRREPWFWRGDFPLGVKDPGYRELFVRWAQFGCFLTMLRFHGTDTPREIWRFGEKGEPFYDALEKAIRFRYELKPLLKQLLEETCRTGLPPQRHPALQFPHDPELQRLDTEMMLGDRLLFCPVTRPMYYLPGGERIETPDETLKVYLPSGCRWRRFRGESEWDGGRWITLRVPLDEMAVFERAD
ncbi:MAG: glycoside hydrolase [Clostridia bacterium]|nr:glycoside hydrolase [Clostridia bacterium]